jgi:hypothetical protein
MLTATLELGGDEYFGTVDDERTTDLGHARVPHVRGQAAARRQAATLIVTPRARGSRRRRAQLGAGAQHDAGATARGAVWS